MTIFNMLFCGVSLHMFMTYFYPTVYQRFLIETSFQLILLYSKCELYVKNNSMICSIIRDFYKKNVEIEIIKCNSLLLTTNKNNLILDLIFPYDFIIYSDYSGITKINKIIYYNTPINFPINFNYDICDYSFISLNITNVNKSNDIDIYNIKLSSEIENYYIIGNKINKLMICYLLKSQHGIYDEIKTYTLNIIDANVNMLLLNETDEIIFNKSEYEIVPYKKEKDEDEDDENEEKDEEDEEKDEEDEEKDDEDEAEEDEDEDEEDEDEDEEKDKDEEDKDKEWEGEEEKKEEETKKEELEEKKEEETAWEKYTEDYSFTCAIF